ncbi:MAG: GNAT family N-acetyltransferase [Acidimicrobiia bacterium]|nr:GNAT family N-acetyltransferase [Acidimicrobiia bacterium]
MPAAQAFFRRIPEADRTFFKEDVLDGATVSSWAHDERSRRLVGVEEDGTVVGYAAVIPLHGWSSHVGELRVVTDPGRRRQGLGRDLARRGLITAIELGLDKVVVEVVADQTAAVAMFQALGFEGEALLRDHVRDRDGKVRDLLVLAHGVQDTHAILAATGIEDAVAGS